MFQLLVIIVTSLLACFLLHVTLRFGAAKKTTAAAPAPAASPPPGSVGLPLLGETLAFIAAKNSSKGVYQFVQTRHLRYGKCFRTNILGRTHVFVSSAEVARALLGHEHADFSKRYMRSISALLGEQSLLCAASHEQHKLVRRGIAGLFTSDSMAASLRKFDELVVETLSCWQQDRMVLVLNDALKITFNAICYMLISLEDEDKLDMLRNDVSEVSEAMLAFPLCFPGTRFYRGLKARRRIMDTLERIIEARRKGLEHHEDFLQTLVSREESLISNEALADQQLLDNILTLIIAGQVTTASSIAWMVKYLGENIEIQEKLRASNVQLSSKVFQSSLDPDALNDMFYASKIVKESLRMATIVSWFPRVALKDCEIEGYAIRKGWIVNVDARSIHFDPELYNEPMKFDPSRFDELPKPYSFLAFGTGGRTCLGMNLAKSMMLVFLHRLVTTYKWKVTDCDEGLEKGAMFPMLGSGCPITVYPYS